MNAALRATGLLLLIAAASNLAFGEDRRPRVLILGDRVYQQPARDAAKELKGRVEVVFATIQPGEVRHTQHAIDNLDTLLGEGDWDLIHFNFGLGDLVRRAPKMKAFRVMSREMGGVRTTSPAVRAEPSHAG